MNSIGSSLSKVPKPAPKRKTAKALEILRQTALGKAVESIKITLKNLEKNPLYLSDSEFTINISWLNSPGEIVVHKERLKLDNIKEILNNFFTLKNLENRKATLRVDTAFLPPMSEFDFVKEIKLVDLTEPSINFKGITTRFKNPDLAKKVPNSFGQTEDLKAQQRALRATANAVSAVLELTDKQI